MIDYAIMFNVLEGGVVDPIKWSKDALQPDRSIIILDELTLSLYLWHGVKQGLVARRTALRQADSLKGHGYAFGKSIIGMDIKRVKEIDARKIGRDPDTDELNKELEEILNKEFKVLEGFIITFQVKEAEAGKEDLQKGRLKPRPKAEAKLKIEEKSLPKVDSEVKIISKSIESSKEVSDLDDSSRIERLENKLDSFINEFEEFKKSINLEKTPSFIQNLRAMKEAIKKGEDLSTAPDYPSRKDLVEEKLEEKKNQ